MKARISSLLFFAALLAVWEVFCRVSSVPALVLPPPSSVLATLWSEIVSGGCGLILASLR